MQARPLRTWVATALAVGLACSAALGLLTGALRLRAAPVAVVADAGQAVRAAVMPVHVEAARSEPDGGRLVLLVAVLVVVAAGMASRPWSRLAQPAAFGSNSPRRRPRRDRAPPGAPPSF